MNIITFLASVLANVFFSSADPYIFGSRKRRKAKEKLARKFEAMAQETQADIEAAQIKNPFESASAKSAMATATRQAKQQAKRFANVMGVAGTTPEAMIAAQQATQEGIGSAAGKIAVGAEAQKQAEIANLRNLKAQQMGQYGQIQTSAIEERGSEWGTLFQAIESAGSMLTGGAEAAGTISGGGGALGA